MSLVAAGLLVACGSVETDTAGSGASITVPPGSGGGGSGGGGGGGGGPAPDTAAPLTPANVTATAASSSAVNISWSASTDNVGVTGYTLRRDGSPVTTTAATSYMDSGLTAATLYSYTVSAFDAAGNHSAQSGPASVTTSAGPQGSLDFQARCAQPGVIRCVGFDAPADIAGTYGDNSGILPGQATPELDAAIKASGASSLKFTIPSQSGANTSGSYFTNFSADLQTQFGENAAFFIQWRQRFSQEFLNTSYSGGKGWKQTIIGSGDKPDGTLYASCTALETVVQNTFQRGFAQMYNSCTGSSSHGPFVGFEEPFGGSDFKLQNARPSPYCLYSQSGANRFPPNGNCIGYFPDEWMTFQVKIQTGPRVNDEWVNSVVTLWIAREGQASQMAINFPFNLTAGSPALDQKFGKVWLLPYHTDKSGSQVHPVGFTWYDELIISTTQIADPAP
jgi:hypothetical protein